MTDIIIEAKNVSKIYGTKREKAAFMMKNGATKDEIYKKTGATVALYDVSLTVPRGKIFVIIGLSGSGKSTLVRCFNRLNKPTSGSILFDGTDLMKMSSAELREFRRRKIAMVFQSFGLMSHRDVLGNVAYGLEVRGVARAEREKLAKEALSMVGLEGLENKACGQLSGGMRQRVGLARAIANDPEVLLMDEPFSALDPLVKQDMQSELLSIQRKLKKTVIFITHDIEEAFKLGDTIAIMRDGQFVQIAKPEDMMEHPADDYVRSFIDSADKSKVLYVRKIMSKPDNFVKISDDIDFVIQTMHDKQSMIVYVVDDNKRLKGLLTLDDIVYAQKEGKKIADLSLREINTTKGNICVRDVMSLVANSVCPVAVVDDNEQLIGVLTKSSILSLLV